MKTCFVSSLMNFIITLCLLIFSKHCNGFSNNPLINYSSNMFMNLIKPLIKNLFPFTMTFNPNDCKNLSSIIGTYKSVLNNEDMFLSGTQLLEKYGYRVKTHEVQTSDGYLLTMFRIPSNGPAVFLMHGFSLSPDDFITLGPQSGLAYVLADAGYDVWLGNARGNKYSRRHISLSPASAAFWDFSWDEIGRYDQAAMVDYILGKTSTTQLKVIGYSQGSTTSFVLCSERPEYNNKISVMILLSAVSFSGHINAPLQRMLSGPVFHDLWTLAKSIGMYSVLSSTELFKIFTTTQCGTPELAASLCYNLLSIFAGPDYDQINKTSLPVIFGHYPAGASTKQIAHFQQLVVSGKFRRFDYGEVINFLEYGSAQAPDYPLEKITTKVALVYSDNDWICVYEDLLILRSKLPNVIETYRVPFQKFSHIDFLFARDVKTLVYDKILEILYNN